ncbi:hypothetical protein B0H12DRAFT_1240808 [Mycena haematopus]|nr:hypothetical protein B0H12DRAFT_1240808 [Mycena haematopus]
MHLGEIHVWVSVDGVELSEFAVEYSADGKEASCWIPSECDKKFSVCFEHTNSSADTVNVRVRNVRHKLSGSLRPIWLGHSFETPVLHEKSKKAIGHSSSPSFFVHISLPSLVHSSKVGAEFPAYNSEKPAIVVIRELATFVFKYRPIDTRSPRAQGIAPPVVRAASAASLSEVMDLTLDDDDDAAEIKKLEASYSILRLHILTRYTQARLRVLKKKDVKVKSEPFGVKQEKDFVFMPGEVIDLT